jgi:hypothetical protein
VAGLAESMRCSHARIAARDENARSIGISQRHPRAGREPIRATSAAANDQAGVMRGLPREAGQLIRLARVPNPQLKCGIIGKTVTIPTHIQ